MTSRTEWIIPGCLIGIILSLLVVGVVSSKLLRHVVQITPLVLALIVAAGSSARGRHASNPLFVFWFVIMLLIWLYLLGIAKIISGHFTSAEILCTVAIGICCVLGLVRSLRSRLRGDGMSGAFWFVLFATLQTGAMWLSLRL